MRYSGEQTPFAPNQPGWLSFLELLVLLPLLSAPHPGTAQDNSLGTTNQWRIENFWRAVQASNGPVTVLAFGDSVSDDYLSIQKQFFWRLQEHFGSSGIAFSSTFYQTLGGGAAWAQPDSNWWALHALLPPGSFAVTPSRTCDRLGLFWIASPQGGDFTFSVRTNRSLSAALVLTLNGYAASPIGCYTNVQVQRNDYSLRLDGLTGTNGLIGIQLVDCAANGICTGFMSQDGQSLGAILNTPARATTAKSRLGPGSRVRWENQHDGAESVLSAWPLRISKLQPLGTILDNETRVSLEEARSGRWLLNPVLPSS